MIPPAPPSISAGGGGPSASSSNAGVSNPFQFGFNFDHSGWNVSRGGGTQTATGNAGVSAAPQSDLMATLQKNLPLIALCVVGYMLLKRR